MAYGKLLNYVGMDCVAHQKSRRQELSDFVAVVVN